MATAEDRPHGRPGRPTPVEGVEALHGLAHPLRIRLLSSLRVDGPGTASELGRRLGESSGSTSYHLRQLARYGFVAEDAHQPSRRERRWRLSWVAAAGFSAHQARLTPAGLAGLIQEIAALVGRYEHACAGDPSAERLHLYVQAVPGLTQPEVEDRPQ